MVGPEVRHALGVLADHFAQALELALAHLGQVLAVVEFGGAVVKVNGDIEFAADALAGLLGQRYAVLYRGIHDRDERGHVRGAHAGMFPFMVVEVYELGGLFGNREHGVGGGLHRGHEGEHGAVVVGVLLHVEDEHAGHGPGGVYNSVDLGEVAAFAEIRNAFHEFTHKSSVKVAMALPAL